MNRQWQLLKSCEKDIGRKKLAIKKYQESSHFEDAGQERLKKNRCKKERKNLLSGKSVMVRKGGMFFASEEHVPQQCWFLAHHFWLNCWLLISSTCNNTACFINLKSGKYYEFVSDCYMEAGVVESTNEQMK